MSQKLQTLRDTCGKIMAHVIEQTACVKVVTRTELNEFLEVKKTDPREHLIVSDALLNLVENGYLHRQFLSDAGIVNFWITPKVNGAISSQIKITPDNALLQEEMRSPHPDLWHKDFLEYTEITHLPVIEKAAASKPTWPWAPRPALVDPNEVVHTDIQPCVLFPKEIDTSEFKALAANSEAPIAGQTLVGSVIEEQAEEPEEKSNVVEIRSAGARILRANDYAHILAHEDVRVGFGLTKFAGDCEVEKFSEVVDSIIYANRARMRNDAIHSLIKQRGSTWRVSELLTYMKSRLRMHLVVRSLEALGDEGRIVSYKVGNYTFLSSTEKPLKKVANQTHSIPEEYERPPSINEALTQVSTLTQPIYLNALPTKHDPRGTVAGSPLERAGSSTTAFIPGQPHGPIGIDAITRYHPCPVADSIPPSPEFTGQEIISAHAADPQGILGLYSKLDKSDKGMIISLLLRLQP